MAKSSKKYTSDVTSKASLIEDDYEDFGYDISNAKRYQNPKTPKPLLFELVKIIKYATQQWKRRRLDCSLL